MRKDIYGLHELSVAQIQTLIQTKMSEVKFCFLKMLIHTLPLLIQTFTSVVSTELVKIAAKLSSGSWCLFLDSV